MKIYAYTIAKNEEKIVDRFCDMLQDADGIFVLDTGSTDNTVSMLEERGVVVGHAKISPFDFSVARNKSMELLPEDADLCICIDLDEVLEKGWRKKIEKAYEPGVHRIEYSYNNTFWPDGSVKVSYVRNWFHTRNNFIWRDSIYEWIEYIGEQPERKIKVPEIIVNHYPDLTKPRPNNEILKREAKHWKKLSERMLFYTVHTFFDSNDEEEIALFVKSAKKYLEIVPSWHPARDKESVYRRLGDYYSRNQDKKLAYYYFSEGINACPNYRDSYTSFAISSYSFGDYGLCLKLCENALEIKEKYMRTRPHERAWDGTLNDYASLSAYHLKDYEKAIFHANEALKLLPGDKRISGNLELYKKYLQNTNK